MRCCANCVWSISPDLEEDIMKEQGYSYDDPNRPKAGDCVIGNIHDKNFYCKEHDYIDGMEEYKNYVLYDDKYFGEGYLIISELDNEIVKFIKITLSGENGFPNFYIRAYDKNSIDDLNQSFREITITADKDEPLYNVIYNFAKSLNNRKIYSIDSSNEGKNNLQTKVYIKEASIIITKDIYGVKNATNYIDIFAGDNYSCELYKELINFYNSLETIAIRETKDKDIKKLLLQK